jgi:DNA polymerase-3 subunit epsilon
MPKAAFEVHGLGDDFLRDKPLFRDIAQSFLDFIGPDLMIIHNASFDMKFLNHELGLVNLPKLPMTQALDTVQMARKKFPGSPASLDALCRRFGVDNSGREKHGALLDSEILAEVYLELIGGRQPDFALAPTNTRSSDTDTSTDWRPKPRPAPLPTRLTQAETDAHQSFITKLGDSAIWAKRQ